MIQGAESGSFLRRIDELLQGEDGFYEQLFEALGVDADAPEAEPRRADHRGRARRRRPVTPAAAPVPRTTGAAAGGAGRHVGRQGVPHARPPGGAARPARLASRLGDPALDPETVEPHAGADGAIPASVLRVAVPGETFADALPHLQETYTGTIAYEIEHISDHEQRVWLRQAIESGDPTAAARRRGEARAARAPVRGRGARELPAQGVPRARSSSRSRASTSLVPMLDEAIELARRQRAPARSCSAWPTAAG